MILSTPFASRSACRNRAVVVKERVEGRQGASDVRRMKPPTSLLPRLVDTYNTYTYPHIHKHVCEFIRSSYRQQGSGRLHSISTCKFLTTDSHPHLVGHRGASCFRLSHGCLRAQAEGSNFLGLHPSQTRPATGSTQALYENKAPTRSAPI